MHPFEWIGTLVATSLVAMITITTAPQAPIRHQGLPEYTVDVAIQLSETSAPEVLLPSHRPGSAPRVVRGWVIRVEAEPVSEGLVRLTGSLQPSGMPSVPDKDSRFDIIARPGSAHIVSVSTPDGLRHLRLTPQAVQR